MNKNKTERYTAYKILYNDFTLTNKQLEEIDIKIILALKTEMNI